MRVLYSQQGKASLQFHGSTDSLAQGQLKGFTQRNHKLVVIEIIFADADLVHRVSRHHRALHYNAYNSIKADKQH